MEDLYDEVEETIHKTISKNKKELDYALIKPLSKKYVFSTNGLYIFCGRQGSGKTQEIIRHILMCDRLGDEGKPYYNLIVFCSTSAGLDKTVAAFLPKIKTPIAFVPDTHLLQFLRLHIKRKRKYYSMVKYIFSGFKKEDDEIKRLFNKHHINTNKLKKLEYIVKKIAAYKQTNYPLNLLLILDDFAANPLIKRPDTELCRIITKSRHYNVTSIISVQTTKFIIKNLKRMASDVILWSGVSQDDYDELMKELPHSFDAKELWNEYHKLTNNHSRLELHVIVGKYKLIREGEDKED